jgi:hypothetical protein
MSGEKRARVDWDAVERDYRTGNFTLRELGSKHGCDHAAVARKVKKLEWTQDLSKAVREATKAKLINEAVNNAVNAGQQAVTNTVLAAAETNKQVILGHRNELRDLRDIAASLAGELRQAALLAEEAELLAQIVAGTGAEPKDEAEARRVVNKALALSTRVGCAKALAETYSKLHSGERTAFGLDEAAPETPDGVDSITDTDAARRVAYLMHCGMEAANEAKPVPQPRQAAS